MTYIFDFDGTIADTLDLVVEIGNELLSELGLPTLTEKDVKKLQGMTIPEMVKYVNVPTRLLPQLAIKGRGRLTKRAKHVKPIPGMVDVIKTLHKQDIPLGIVSSSSRESVMTFLQAHKLEDAFEFVDTGAGIFGKSRRLKSSVRKHKLDREQTIYVGDEVRDIEAAHAAGLKVASVTWGLNNVALLSRSNPDTVIEKPTQLLDLAKKQPR